VLVTTLLDHRRVSKDDLRQFCARRWNVELDLRNLKTTTGMYVRGLTTANTRQWAVVCADRAMPSG